MQSLRNQRRSKTTKYIIKKNHFKEREFNTPSVNLTQDTSRIGAARMK